MKTIYITELGCLVHEGGKYKKAKVSEALSELEYGDIIVNYKFTKLQVRGADLKLFFGKED